MPLPSMVEWPKWTLLIYIMIHHTSISFICPLTLPQLSFFSTTVETQLSNDTIIGELPFPVLTLDQRLDLDQGQVQRSGSEVTLLVLCCQNITWVWRETFTHQSLWASLTFETNLKSCTKNHPAYFKVKSSIYFNETNKIICVQYFNIKLKLVQML